MSDSSSLPGPGFIPGQVYLDQDFAPSVPDGQARPFAPGEYVSNPNGSWSSEITMTVQGDKSFNNGLPTVIPSLWLKNGKPYVAKNEDEAIELAKKSGLNFPSFDSLEQADRYSNMREKAWQNIAPSQAYRVPPLYLPTPREFIEPPPAGADMKAYQRWRQSQVQGPVTTTPIKWVPSEFGGWVPSAEGEGLARDYNVPTYSSEGGNIEPMFVPGTRDRSIQTPPGTYDNPELQRLLNAIMMRGA